jgi:hypothetical protein
MDTVMRELDAAQDEVDLVSVDRSIGVSPQRLGASLIRSAVDGVLSGEKR